MSKKEENTAAETPNIPKKDERVRITLRIPSRLHEQLRHEAITTDRTVTSIFVEILHERYPTKP